VSTGGGTGTSGARAPRLLIVTTVHQTLRAFLLPFADHQRALGWQVDAATAPDPEVAEIAGHFDEIHPVSWARTLGSPGNVRGLREIRAVIKRGRYDVVHVHTPIAAFVTRAAVATLRKRPAVVYTAHGFHFYEGGSPRRNRVYRTAERVAGRWTDRLIVINDEDRGAALRYRIVPAGRLLHFPGIGVDLDHYAPTPELRAAAASLRTELGLSDGTTVYSMIAEFIPRKNHDAAVRAFARLADSDARLVLAGGGALEPQIRGLVDELGVADRVVFLGMVRDVRPLLLASSALVLPSRQEGLCRAVLESLTVGVPVVGGRTRGIRDLVDPDLGCLVAPDDVDGLAKAMTDVLTMPTGGALRDRSLERMQTYSLAHIVALHERLYGDLLKARSDSPT
jgi:glycosyltransferase involved in cell wall biosynthesis